VAQSEGRTFGSSKLRIFPSSASILHGVGVLALCAGCGPSPRALQGVALSGPALHGVASVVRSNVTRDDYVGSAVCARCHSDVAAAWERSPMHRMTRVARGADVQAPFDGTRWRFKTDAVVLEGHDGDRFMRIESSIGTARTYRVTRVIGGRTREDFAGVATEGADSTEVILPVSFVLATRALRYKGYSVMVHERASLRAGPVWSRTCIFCHNTVPEVDRLFAAIAGPGARAYQGESVDPWLPAERQSRVRVTDEQRFAQVATAELGRLQGRRAELRGTGSEVARRAIEGVRAGFDGGSLVEVGIGCEACHGGGREHAADPAVRLTFVPTAPWLDVAPPTGDKQAEVRVCARCHQVLFSGYPFTWEGGRRDSSAGGSHINSGEARDFLLGACAGAMSCTQCHDPHGGATRVAVLATSAGNARCTACHTEFGDRARLQAHAHHDPDGPGGACVACHMPRKNMGLNGKLTRYHRIGSPTDPARVLGDRPLECALCHADRSVRDLVEAMETWWAKRYPRQRLEELYGSFEANVMRATLERGKAHERIVASATLGEARAKDAAPLIGRELSSEYPLEREWAKRALESIFGHCDVDLTASAPKIAEQAASCAGAPVVPSSAVPRDDDAED
jgi:predicted CXXCH cytochrome family protein